MSNQRTISCVICELPCVAFRTEDCDPPLCAICAAFPVLVAAFREGLVRKSANPPGDSAA